MKFIADTQLPPKLSAYLQSEGHDCIHTTDFENGHLLQDSEIIEIAIEQERTVITKDSDFSDHYFLKGAPPKILLLLFGNISNKDLTAYFEQYLGNIVTAFGGGSNYIQFSRDGIATD